MKPVFRRLDRNPDPGPPGRVAAFVPNWIGDAAMCTPALRALRRRFPETELIALGRSSVCALLEDIPWLDRLITIPARAGLAAMMRLSGDFRLRRHDRAVLFSHSFRSAALARILGARHVLGYARGSRSPLLTQRMQPHRENNRVVPIYMAVEYLELVRAWGCEDDGSGLELHAKPALVEAFRARFRGPGPLVGLAPGAAFGPSKCWPAERYAAVADALAERAGAQCVLLTGPGEEATRDAVLGRARTRLAAYHDGAPSIALLKAAISQLDVFLGNDSGPRHIAVAFGVPVVCLMGPTSPRYSSGPYEKGAVLRIDVPCGPCQKPVCATDHRCMTGIAVEQVVQAALERLPSI